MWLAQHRATLDPNGNGLHRQLAALVEHHGLAPVVATFEELAADPKTHTARQFILGTANRLDPIPAAPSARNGRNGSQFLEHPETEADRAFQR